MKTLLEFFSSLKLTVVLFALSIFLVFAGTLAQIDQGIWSVVDQYFRSMIAWIDCKIFFPRTWNIQGKFPWPGGWCIGFFLMLNIVCAHVRRFKVVAKGNRRIAGLIVLLAGFFLLYLIIIGTFDKEVATTEDDAFWRVLWRLGKGGGAAIILYVACWLLFKKRAGIVLLHGGIFLLLVSELITGLFAIESTMVIKEGETVNFMDRSTELELAIIDRSEKDVDHVVCIPASRLLPGTKVNDKALPFDVETVKYMVNSSVPVELKGAHASEKNLATKGTGLQYHVHEIGEESGVSSSQQKDTPSAYLTFKDKDSQDHLGTWLVSLWFYGNHTNRELDIPQKVESNGKTYDVYLRYRREYLRSKGSETPFSLHLIDFKHDTYLGTNRPSNYSSLVQLQDADKNIDREINIWMNNPLRYAGLTFYQSSFLQNDSGTILQVVRNFGWMIPYISCMIVTIGLLVHFFSTMMAFIRKTISNV